MGKGNNPIKEGDLVTISLNEYQLASNTYIVARKFETESLLCHPLAPEIYILRQDSELNQSFPSIQNQVEKALYFSQKNKELIGHTMRGDLSSLCYFYVIHKELTLKQRQDLSNICGKIAAIKFNNNLGQAVTLIKQNKMLLDEYNHSLFNSVKKVIADPLSLQTKQERYTIYNIAGFILAQSSVQ